MDIYFSFFLDENDGIRKPRFFLCFLSGVPSAVVGTGDVALVEPPAAISALVVDFAGDATSASVCVSVV
jgi:hypothetical protein